MAKEIKKVGLLKDVDSNKKPAATSTTTSQATAGGATAAQTARSSAKAQPDAKSGGKFWLVVLISFVVLLVVFPKPELIVYRKMNIQASSIYWPGLFGRGEGLLDSNLQVSFDTGRNEMNLCFEAKSKTDCQTYTIDRRDGLVGVIGHLLQ